MIELLNLQSTFGLRESPAGLPLGSEVATIDSVSFRDFDQDVLFNARNIDLVSEAESRSGVLGGSLQLKVDTLSTENDVYGPLDFQVVINGLDEDALVNANEAVRTILNETKDHPKNRESKLQRYMKNRGWKVFEGAPYIKYEISRLKLDDGDFSASVELGMSGLEGKDLRKPKLVAGKLSADVRVNVPKVTLVNWIVKNSRTVVGALNALPVPLQGLDPSGPNFPAKAIDGLNDALEAGMILDEGQSYSTHLRLSKGEVSINGEKLLDADSFL